MLVLAATLVGSFILWSVLFADEVDDEDDGPSGGMMIPVPNSYIQLNIVVATKDPPWQKPEGVFFIEYHACASVQDSLMSAARSLLPLPPVMLVILTPITSGPSGNRPEGLGGTVCS